MHLFDDETIKWATTNSQGTKMPVIDWKVLEKKEILLPTDSLLENYRIVTSSILNLIKKISFKNQNLHKTRDFLLPKLISGEVDVSNLDIKISEEVANT
jgi:type I restriction enzyme S subunit